MLSDYQKEIISKLPKDRQDFIKKQTNIHQEGMLKNGMFMPNDGYCYHCKADLIKHELKNGNDGSGLVTDCFNCFKSYCD